MNIEFTRVGPEDYKVEAFFMAERIVVRGKTPYAALTHFAYLVHIAFEEGGIKVASEISVKLEQERLEKAVAAVEASRRGRDTPWDER